MPTTWQVWTTSNATTMTGAAWDYWVTTALGTTNTLTGTYRPDPLTEDQLRQQRAQWEERQARERADREEAVKRAETLLHGALTRHQRQMLKSRRRFYVRSQHGRRYEIERGHHANVYEVDRRGRRLARLCIYTTGGTPEGDCMLAQKLHLQSNEDEFRRVAHITRLVAA